MKSQLPLCCCLLICLDVKGKASSHFLAVVGFSLFSVGVKLLCDSHFTSNDWGPFNLETSTTAQMVTDLKEKKKKSLFFYRFVSLRGLSFVNRGVLGPKKRWKGREKQSGPIYVTFIFLLSDTLITAGVSTRGNGRGRRITRVILVERNRSYHLCCLIERHLLHTKSMLKEKIFDTASSYTVGSM